MKRIEIFVPGHPAHWERAAGKSGRYNTKQHEAGKDKITTYTIVAMRRAKLKAFVGPVKLTVLAVFPRNKTRPAWASKEHWALGCRLHKPTTPDADNIAKLSGDSIQLEKEQRGRSPAFCIEDDKTVCVFHATKVIAAVGEKPHAVITVEELHPCYNYNEVRAGATNAGPSDAIDNRGVNDDER